MPSDLKIDQQEFSLATKGMKGLVVRAKLSPMRSRVVMQQAGLSVLGSTLNNTVSSDNKQLPA
jgi:hypothetical protein